MLGAGNNLEPFFAFYPFHEKEHVQKILSGFKIGELHPEDRVKEENIPKFDTAHGGSVFNQEKSKNLKILQSFPLIAETDSKILVTHFITSNAEFFVRGHQHIPECISPDSYRLSILN
jgi:sulfite oxidase